MIDRGIPVAIRRGSAKTNSEHEQTDASRDLDPMLSEAGLVPNKYLCVHFFLDSGSGFIDASSAVFRGRLGNQPQRTQRNAGRAGEYLPEHRGGFAAGRI